MKPNCLQILREQKDSNLPGGLYHKECLKHDIMPFILDEQHK